MTVFQTPLTHLLGLRFPIVNAPMTPAAGGELARAVGDGGGFGMLGFDEDESESELRAQVDILRRDGERSFGIGLAAWVLEKRPQLLDLAISARPKMISISFGDPSPFIEKVHGAGILASAQVQSRAWARTALDAGVDVLVAQGTEAGGHTGNVGTLPLLQIVLDMTDKPVIAAGGIATGRGIAAVLAAGAAGAWIGTPFLVSRESRTPAPAKERILASDETQTIRTHVYDRLQGKPWPEEFGGRALRNPFAEKWNGREDELMRSPEDIAAFKEAKASRDYSRAHIYAGQSVGLIAHAEGAAEIVERLAHDAYERLAACAALIAPPNS
jgi:nitronate monooxygenase